MAEIVAYGNCFGQILIKPQCTGNGTGDLGNLKGVGKSCAVMIPLGIEKNLGFVFKPAEGVAVYYAVAVTLKTGSDGIGLLKNALPSESALFLAYSQSR